jgi:hypothetical protein
VLRVLTAADVGALADDYAPAWGDVTSKPSTYPPSSHSHSWSSLSGKPFRYQEYSVIVPANSNTTFNPFTANKSTTLIIARMSTSASPGTIVGVANKNYNNVPLIVLGKSSDFDMDSHGSLIRLHNGSLSTCYSTIQVISWDY